MLGVKPRFDLGERVYEINIQSGSLKNASGDVPISGGGTIHVAWVRKGATIELDVKTSKPIHLKFGPRDVEVLSTFKTTIPASPV